MSGRIGVPPVIVCPRCEGQQYDRESCGFCDNSGYLREDGERLSYAQRVQMLATLSLSTHIPLGNPAEVGNHAKAYIDAPTLPSVPEGAPE